MKAPASLAASLLGVAAALVAIVLGASAIGAEPGLPTNPNLPSQAVAYGYDAPVDVSLGRTVEPAVSQGRSVSLENAAAVAERIAGDNYHVARNRVAARVADDFVYLASPQRCTHILDGDATGSGHRWPGAPDKTPFSQGWGDDQIMHHVSDIATDASLRWNWAKGSPSGYTRAGDPSRASVFGVRVGVCIKVVVEPAGEGIISAHPSPGSC